MFFLVSIMWIWWLYMLDVFENRVIIECLLVVIVMEFFSIDVGIKN